MKRPCATNSELNRCKPEILQVWCDQAQDDSARPLCPYCGGPMRHKGSRPRTLICPSGRVEARCKSLVQARCKQAGMRWHTRGLEPLLRVRCAVTDGRDERDVGDRPDNLLAW